MVPPVSDRISPVPPYSGYYPSCKTYVYGIFTLFDPSFQKGSTSFYTTYGSPTTPHSTCPCGLGFSAFARHYLRNHYCFLFLRVLRCFSSPGFLVSRLMPTSSAWVAPFGHLRINGRLHLPVAFRSLPRPSSSLRAKASPVRPYLLPSLCSNLHSIFMKLQSKLLLSLC